ncbi:MAG: hypothetical protein K2X95_05795, partial [Flavobacteriaceae bacterium]|nr:hypothetical protein [Flavobacteriaceae bacterium]
SFGFNDIPVYDEVEIPEEFRQYLLFMELDLAQFLAQIAVKILFLNLFRFRKRLQRIAGNSSQKPFATP